MFREGGHVRKIKRRNEKNIIVVIGDMKKTLPCSEIIDYVNNYCELANQFGYRDYDYQEHFFKHYKKWLVGQLSQRLTDGFG